MKLREKEEPKRPGSAQPLERYFEDAGNLPAHAFETQHGGAYLLLSATGLSGPKGLSGTEVALLADEDQRAATADIAVLVFPLCAAPGAPGDLITIGWAPDFVPGFSIFYDGADLLGPFDDSVTLPERCDDGNSSNTDACSNSCQLN